MSTRIGVNLPDHIYKEYKKILFNKEKTIQDNLIELITMYIKEHKGNNEQ